MPSESVGTVATAGVVNVLYGVDGTGLSATRTQMWQQGSTGSARVGGTPERGDELGFALAASDFNGDGTADLAAGAPFEGLGSVPRAGAFHVVRGSASGLTTGGRRLLTQDSPGVGGAAEPDDAFGFALSALHPTG